ncbi:hypothetical protein BDV96DRAFT_472440, partial [Lophiotrema nucula]
MSRLPVSPYWSTNPNIPIYLDTSNTRESSEPNTTTEHTCPTCQTSSRDQPIHCVSVSPAPPSYSSVASQGPPSQHLAVPTLTLETPHRWSRPQPPRPALQLDPEGRPQVRFRRNAFSPLSPATVDFESIDWSRKTHVGLGIPDAPFRPDASPITPSQAEKNGEERSEDLPAAANFIQRIEQKLWNYSASKNVVKRWLVEIISWSLSAACMGGIVAMLLVYKNDRVPRWPLGLTLNAYISVLAKVASASLLLPVSEALGQLKWSWFRGDNSKKMWDFELFDNASRGPWGSFLLLVRTKGTTLAALGAAVTVFALALDPFFQQVVDLPERWRLQEEQGSVPRAISYEPFSAGREYRSGMQSLELDTNLQGITFHYFYDNGTLPLTFGKGKRVDIPLACPNRNCTWPAYESLSVCNKCVEASDQLEFGCRTSALDWIQVPGVDNETSEATYPNGTSCGWWLKADTPLLMTGYDVDSKGPHKGEILLGRSQPMYDIFTRELLPGYQSKLNFSRNPLAHAIIASAETVDNVHRNVTPIAHECLISWCVQTLLSSYSEGGYTENITNIVVNDTLSSTLWHTEEIFVDGEPYGTKYVYGENVTVLGPSGQKYRIDNNTHVLSLSLFDDIFPSTYVLANSTDMRDAMLRYKEYLTVEPCVRNTTYNPWLYNNITTQLDHLCTAMTNMIRSYQSTTEMVAGPSFDTEPVVDVRWGWLALPLGLLGMTGIFLLATVFRSSREQDHVGVWKTSAIATLLYGLPDHMQQKMTQSKVTGTPRAKAKEVKVKWLPNRGWRFSGNTISPTSLKSDTS